MKLMLICSALILILIIIWGSIYFSTSQVSNKEVSGTDFGNQIWSGEITVTGDVIILHNLEILPGAIIKFKVQDDKKKGDETPADGYNDLDPTRLESYTKTHSSLLVLGKLYAVGTPDKRITFTSAAEKPSLADWEGLTPGGDGSRIEYPTIEWSRHGIGLGGKSTPNSVFSNNILRNTLWGALSLGDSSAQAYNNELYECGHEGIDIQRGSPIIINNTVRECHAGIVVLTGKPTIKNNRLINVSDGIFIAESANAVLENNEVQPADPKTYSSKEWRYGNFAYRMFAQPKVYT